VEQITGAPRGGKAAFEEMAKKLIA
jgi:hypothetical protein